MVLSISCGLAIPLSTHLVRCRYWDSTRQRNLVIGVRDTILLDRRHGGVGRWLQRLLQSFGLCVDFDMLIEPSHFRCD